MMRTAVADLRYACRVLFRTPSFTMSVIAVLALGIGANAAIFSIVNSVLLRPLPFREPARLVMLFHEPPQTLSLGFIGSRCPRQISTTGNAMPSCSTA